MVQCSTALSLKEIPVTIHSIETEPPKKGHQILHSDRKDAQPLLIADYDNGESLMMSQPLSILDYLEDSYPN